MERRSHSTEREEEHDLFPIYSERSQQDMSAMVSALTQVMGGSNDSLQHHEHLLTSSNNTSSQNNNEQSQVPQQDQGKCLTKTHTGCYPFHHISFLAFKLDLLG